MSGRKTYNRVAPHSLRTDHASVENRPRDRESPTRRLTRGLLLVVVPVLDARLSHLTREEANADGEPDCNPWITRDLIENAGEFNGHYRITESAL